MKQVLRESLWLLSAGQYLSLLDDRETIVEVALTYADFSQLRPEYSASSWRGAMLKAQERGWIHKRLVSGKTSFQLTKTGREVLATDFQAFRQFLGGSKSVALLAFKPVGKSSSADAATVRSWLLEAAGISISSGLWAFPSTLVPDWLLARFRKAGFLTLILVGSKTTGQKSLDLFSWVQEKRLSDHSTAVSLLEKSSNDMSTLLNILETRKNLHHLQISKIGSEITLVYSELRKMAWIDFEDAPLLEAVFRALQISDQLLAAWIRSKEAG